MTKMKKNAKSKIIWKNDKIAKRQNGEKIVLKISKTKKLLQTWQKVLTLVISSI